MKLPSLVVRDRKDDLGHHVLKVPARDGKKRSFGGLGKLGKFLARYGLQLKPYFLEGRLDDDLGIILLEVDVAFGNRGEDSGELVTEDGDRPRFLGIHGE